MDVAAEIGKRSTEFQFPLPSLIIAPGARVQNHKRTKGVTMKKNLPLLTRKRVRAQAMPKFSMLARMSNG